MPRRTLKRARERVEAAKESRSNRRSLRQRLGADARRVRDAVERRVVPVEDEARQTRREAGLLSRELGLSKAAARARALGDSARDTVMGIDFSQMEGADDGPLAQLGAIEDEAFAGSALLGESIDDEMLGGEAGPADLDAVMLGGIDGEDDFSDFEDVEMID